MTEEMWQSIKEGGRYRVDASDGERLIVDVVTIDNRDRLFVYDIVTSDQTFHCRTGHVLRFTEIDDVEPLFESTGNK